MRTPASSIVKISAAAFFLTLSRLGCRQALAQQAYGDDDDSWKRAAALVERGGSAKGPRLLLAQFGQQSPLPPPIAPPPTMTPSFQALPQQLSEMTRISKDNEVVQSIIAARGSDPTKWFIPPAVMQVIQPAVAVPAMRPMEEKLAPLRAELKRLEQLLDADGIINSIQGMTCVIGAQSNLTIQRLQQGSVSEDSPGEDLADEIASLNIAIANTRKAIDEIEHSPEFARKRYLSCLRASGVDVKSDETLPAPGEQRIYPRASPQINAAPSVEAKEFKDCSPRLEDYTDNIYAPYMVGFNGAGEPQYNWHWVEVRKSRMVKPDGCW